MCQETHHRGVGGRGRDPGITVVGAHLYLLWIYPLVPGASSAPVLLPLLSSGTGTLPFEVHGGPCFDAWSGGARSFLDLWALPWLHQLWPGLESWAFGCWERVFLPGVVFLKCFRT